MSNFGLELGRFLDRSGLKVTDVANASGVSASLISRIRSGKVRRVTPNFLKSVLPVISSDPRAHARMLRACLVDYEMPGIAELQLAPICEGETGIHVALATIGHACVEHRELRDTVFALAGLVQSCVK